MIKSMTGYSKTEASEKGVLVSVELKSLNGRYLEVSTKLPKYLSHKEIEVKELVRSASTRGTVNVLINIEADQQLEPFSINEDAAVNCYNSLQSLKKKLNIKEPVNLSHVLMFSNNFYMKDSDENVEIFWRVALKAIKAGIKKLDTMKKNEGKQIAKDIQERMNSIQKTVSEIEELGIERVPAERERLRQRIAQLFESDEIDEYRLQMEMVIQADKLDISEECVRLSSHLKFFFEALKAKEAVGRKLNFLLQEMHREVNTIGSKINDATISQKVVSIKEELERIREQVQNIE